MVNRGRLDAERAAEAACDARPLKPAISPGGRLPS
jgi:hypothetical protein